MQRRKLRMAMVLLAGVLAGSGRTASAIADVNEFTGRWSGFLKGVSDPDIRPAVLDVSSTKNRRIEGGLRGVGDPQIRIGGTLSAAGFVELQGVSEDDGGTRLFARGKFRSVGDPQIVGDPEIRIAALSWELVDAKGRSRGRGHMLLVRMEGGPAWDRTPGTNVTGPWSGDAPSDGNPASLAELSLLNLPGPLKQGTTALAGTATFLGLSLPRRAGPSDLLLDLNGTVGNPDIREGTSPMGLVGSDPENGIVAILLGWVHPEDPDARARIEGRYLLFESLADAFDWTDAGRGAPYENGDLSLFSD